MDETRSRLTRSNQFGSTRKAACAALSIGSVMLFVGWPTLRIMLRGLNLTSVSEVVGNSRYWRIVAFTIIQATLSTVATLALAIPTAWLIGTRNFVGRRLLTGLWSATFTLPTVVVGSAFLAILPTSVNRSLLAIVSAHVFFNVGMAARLIGDAWSRVTVSFDDIAATLGASPRAVTRMLLAGPLRKPLASTAGLVMTLSLTSFGVILMLGGPTRSTTETEIFRQATQQLALGRAAVLALIQLLIVSAVLAWTTSTRSTKTTGTAAHAVDRRRPVARAEQPIAVSICTAISVVVVLPLAMLFMRSIRDVDGHISLRTYQSLTSTRPGNGLLNAPIDAVATSLRAAAMAAVIAVVLTVATVAGTRGRLAAVIAGLPLAVSGAILGFGALIGFARPPFPWRSRWWLVPIMQGVVALPYAIRVLRPAVEDIDPRLAEAAATLGASPRSTWWRVQAPLLLRPFLSAAALATTVALGEFGVTSFLVRPKQETLPVAIATLSSRPGTLLLSQSAALAVILGILTMILVGLTSSVRRDS